MAEQLNSKNITGETIQGCLCRVCRAEIASESLFCRWCGIQQSDLSVAIEHTNIVKSYTDALSQLSPYKTTPFTEGPGDFTEGKINTDKDIRVSGYLIRSFVQSVKTTSSHFQGGFEKAALALLTFIPVCLLIIFLSPLDAYFAAKNLLKG